MPLLLAKTISERVLVFDCLEVGEGIANLPEPVCQFEVPVGKQLHPPGRLDRIVQRMGSLSGGQFQLFRQRVLNCGGSGKYHGNMMAVYKACSGFLDDR